MHGCMDHHGACFGYYNTDSTLSNTTLPLGSHSGEANLLVVSNDLLGEGLTDVDTIVSVVFFDSYPNISGHILEGVLGVDGISGVQSNLVLHMDVS
jgi:hypothetical protein